ncbi:MAG: DNA polymerase IV [Planctomycetota bacterium]
MAEAVNNPQNTQPRRTIFHVDMDAFFAAIAVRDDPSLRGKAVLTGGTGKRGVVTTASYEARKFGCRSAMPTATALRLCPHAICVKVPGEKIREASQAMFAVLDDFSPLVQPLSVDEAFLDMTGTARLMGPPEVVAKDLKKKIFLATNGLVASVGVAPNKFLAKLASDLEKPDGLTVVPSTPEGIQALLDPLPIAKIWGVGPATQRKLEQHGIKHVADLRRLTEDQLTHTLGDHARRFFRLARGLDDRPVVPDRQAKSIGHEQTFAENLTDPDAILAVMLDQSEQVGYRLRKHQLRARGVTVKIRFGDFQTITRSTTLDTPTDVTSDLYATAKALFRGWAESSFRSVRLVGVSAYPLTNANQQTELFPDPKKQKQKQLDTALDAITNKFGKRTVHRGSN